LKGEKIMPEYSRTATRVQTRPEVMNAFMRGVYGWMTAGLLLTAGVAWLVASTPAVLLLIQQNPFLFFGMMIAELGLVMVISAAINKLSPAAASGLFLLYSALNGATLSLILTITAHLLGSLPFVKSMSPVIPSNFFIFAIASRTA